MPDPDCADDREYDAIWALADSGSSVHVVDIEQRLPSAVVDTPPANSNGFKCANGTVVPHRGLAVVPFNTAEGYRLVANKTACLWTCPP